MKTRTTKQMLRTPLGFKIICTEKPGKRTAKDKFIVRIEPPAGWRTAKTLAWGKTAHVVYASEVCLPVKCREEKRRPA
jgi:hypothetical protein